MQEQPLGKAVRLLQFSCFGFLAFALFWWLVIIPGLDSPGQLILDVSVWPIDGSANALGHSAKFLSVIGAGLLSGFSLLILLVVVPEIKKGNSSIIRGTIIAVLAWFVIDSVGCLYLGVISNAVLNTVYVTLILIPLTLASRAMKT